MKFEWTGSQFVPEGGDSEGVTITDVTFKAPGEPIAVEWTSNQQISTVLVKSSTDLCDEPGGTAGTAESCGPPNSTLLGSFPEGSLAGWLLSASSVLAAVGVVARRRLT